MELRYAEFRGLNLTFEVREGIIKHSHDYSAAEHPELAEYLLDLRPPLEAQLIDLTDEIAYSTADMDDGFEAKLLRLPQIRKRVRVFERYYVEAEAKYPDAPEKLKFNEALKRVLNRFVTDLIENTHGAFKKRESRVWKSCAIIPSGWRRFSPEVEDGTPRSQELPLRGALQLQAAGAGKAEGRERDHRSLQSLYGASRGAAPRLIRSESKTRSWRAWCATTSRA